MIGLYNLEPQYTNIALEKVRLFYEGQGERVEDYLPLKHGEYDMVYCSSIFTWTNKPYVTPDVVCGGTGFDLKKTLNPAIEKMKPRINMGFTTRGCIRHCPFCVVPEKEGSIRVVGDIYDFWDGNSTEITILDNNILAVPEHFKRVWNQLNREGLRIKEHGLDIRLIDDEIASILKSVRYKQYHFAFDNMGIEDAVRRGITILRKHHITPMVYVLIGYDSTPEEDLYRVELLRSLKTDPFVMPFNKQDLYQKAFARWVNHKAVFKSCTWKDYRGKIKVG